jgi:ribonuclease BN (tRNA processing enzyme)
VYTSDIGNKNDLLLFEHFKTDILISEVTHVTINEIIHAIEQIKPKHTYLTHIPDDETNNLQKDLVEFKSKLKKSITLAEDGLSFQI